MAAHRLARAGGTLAAARAGKTAVRASLAVFTEAPSRPVPGAAMQTGPTRAYAVSAPLGRHVIGWDWLARLLRCRLLTPRQRSPHGPNRHTEIGMMTRIANTA